jgi:hypothetical protein
LQRILAELPSWLRELEVAVARQARTSRPDGGKPTKRPYPPLPYDTQAAELADRMRNELGTAIRHLCESRGIETPKIARTADMAVWLSSEDVVAATRQDEAAVEAIGWARSLRDAIKRQVDNLGTRFAGPCTARIRTLSLETGSTGVLTPVTVERECGADLRARSGDQVIVCPYCQTKHDARDVMAAVIQRNHEHHARPVEIADSLTRAGWPVRAATIRKWVEREKLFSWRDDEFGRALYRVGDVLDLVKAARPDVSEESA